MNRPRWEQIQAVFHDAAACPVSEREAFLKTRCGDDRSLMDEVRVMLEADRQSSSLLDRGLSNVAYRVIGESSQAVPLLDFGPYRLKRILGEGGMGVVWLAERADTHNLVAIKFLPHAGFSPARRERFAREIKALAKLKHQFIARLYDAGALADGTPWFVMEYVDGSPLTEYSQKRDLRMDERLRLFRSVCEAVQYAHGQEIIHRDLKPSNILVERDGTPRLLDFGVARELHSADEPSEETQPALRFLSPDYAAPEWIREGAAGFYTDVYSLGVILYELLTGRRPFQGSRAAGEGPPQLDTVEEPDPPSAVANPKKGASLNKTAWKDLDVLCLRAMHRDPSKRYQSVEALTRDIDHYLHAEPLEARPDTLSYRAGKFVRRNRRAVIVASLFFALLVGVVLFFTLRLAKARDAALAEAARTRRVEEFMTNLFEGGDEEAGPSEDLRVVTLLDRGVRDAQALSRDPMLQADLYQTLGSVYQSLGNLDQADSLLQKAMERRKAVFGPNHEKVAESLVYLGVLRRDQARLADAERLLREGLAMDRRNLPPDDPAVAKAASALADVLEKRGSYDEAIALLDRALRSYSASKGGVNNDQLGALTLLANAHHYLGHYAISDSLNRQILVMDKQLHGDHHPDVAEDFLNLGSIQSQWGHYQEAERYYRGALEIFQSWYGEDHPETAETKSYVAKALISQGRYDEAEILAKQALAALERTYSKTPNPRVALTLGQLGAIALDRGKLDEAEADFSRMAEIYQSVYGNEHQMTAIALSNLAAVYLEKGEYVRAERLLRDVIQRLGRTLPAGHLNTGVARMRLGRVLLREKRYKEAEIEILAGYDILTKQTSSSVKALQLARQDLVAVYEALNTPEKAAKFRAELAANATGVK